MCGIAGFNWSDRKLIKRMSNVMSYRGPDDSGEYIDKYVSLGHRRLSIIDLSKLGHQPMFNKDKSIAIVFNGEIWNYPQLKIELESKGYKFKSNSDTAVIIHGYTDYGEKICSILDGMFAFAIWDSKKRKLILARDKIGKKPLYYYFDNKKLIFASEIKSILEHNIMREINLDCLSDYLILRYSPDGITMLKEIQKLPAGSYAVFSSGKLDIKKYYYLPNFKARHTEDQKKADWIISESIRKRLISDVPIGVFLSGGLDSSAIVAYMSKFTKDIRTFSVGFSGSVDETKYARIVANKFRTKHKEIHLDSDILRNLPEVIYHFDEPLADPAALPTFLLCREVSKHVKVALSGEGGDEVFGGYQTFNSIPYLKILHSMPFFIRKLLFYPLKLASSFSKYPKKQILLLLSEISADNSVKNNFKRLFYFPFNKEDKKQLLKNARINDSFDYFLNGGKTLDVSAQEYYFNEWLPNDLLMKADKMSMASSLEVRTPFLDKELISYFAGLSYKSKHNRNFFRKIVSRYLPSSIMRKKKQGFTLPLSEWFSDKKNLFRLIPFIERLKKRGIFDAVEIDKIINNPEVFRNDHKLWVLLNFEIWYEIFIDKKDYRKI